MQFKLTESKIMYPAKSASSITTFPEVFSIFAMPPFPIRKNTLIFDDEIRESPPVKVWPPVGEHMGCKDPISHSFSKIVQHSCIDASALPLAFEINPSLLSLPVLSTYSVDVKFGTNLGGITVATQLPLIIDTLAHCCIHNLLKSPAGKPESRTARPVKEFAFPLQTWTVLFDAKPVTPGNVIVNKPPVT